MLIKTVKNRRLTKLILFEDPYLSRIYWNITDNQISVPIKTLEKDCWQIDRNRFCVERNLLIQRDEEENNVLNI